MAAKIGGSDISSKVIIPKPNHSTLEVKLIGSSPLIMHAWSSKAKKEILDKQQKKAKNAKQARDPDREYEESIYYLAPPTKDGIKRLGTLEDWADVPMEKRRFCFPANAVKSALVDACSFVQDLTKVLARGALFIEDGVVEIIGKPQKRDDMVTIGMGTKDLRFRAEFETWHTTFRVVYNADILSPEMILNLFAHAGFSVGLGEWRPQKDGVNGRFRAELA
jgi:hypothetical protein